MKDKRAAKAKARRRKEKAERRALIEQLTPSEIIEGSVEYDTIMWLFMLHEKFGFGKKRLERAITYRNELGDAVDQGYLDFNDMNKVLTDEVKMER